MKTKKYGKSTNGAVAELIAHLNEDHADTLVEVSRHYGEAAVRTAVLRDVRENGCVLEVDDGSGHLREQRIPFALKGDSQEQILYLIYCVKAAGSDKERKRYYRVQAKKYLTPSMLRITLAVDRAFEDFEPGLAPLFSLKILKAQTAARFSPYLRAVAVLRRIKLWVARFLSRHQRQKVLMSLRKDLRYYTIADVRSDSEGRENRLVDVDIYMHGETPGSKWAKALKPGDVVSSASDYRERFAHLQSGKVLLVADETAFPAVQSLLQAWRNPEPPVLVVVTGNVADRGYLQPEKMPAGTPVLYVGKETDGGAAAVCRLVDGCPPFQAAWGALEDSAARIIRKHVQVHSKMEGKSNKIKAYWK